jgi:hypothetical protein
MLAISTLNLKIILIFDWNKCPEFLTETIKSWSKREKNTTDHVQVAYLVVVSADLRPKEEEKEKTQRQITSFFFKK